MIKKLAIVPITNLMLLDPSQAKRPKMPMIIGQGVLTSVISSHIKKYNKDTIEELVSDTHKKMKKVYDEMVEAIQ